MKMRFTSATFFLALALTSQGLYAQTKDPLVGTWELNRAKSEFNPDNTLQTRTVEFTAKDGGVTFLQRTVTDRGNTVQSDYTAKFDEKDVPISGSQLDSVALKRLDANTVQRTGKMGSKVVETATLKISNGGKTLTITTKGSIDGDEYSSTQVFEKR